MRPSIYGPIFIENIPHSRHALGPEIQLGLLCHTTPGAAPLGCSRKYHTDICIDLLGTEVNKTDKVFASMDLSFWGGGQTVKKKIK